MIKSCACLASVLLATLIGGCEPSDPPPLQEAAPSPPPAAQSSPTVSKPAPPSAESPLAQASDDWRAYAKPADVQRLGRLGSAWDAGLRRARAEGHGAELVAMGPLAVPGGGSAQRLHPSPGQYRCRTYKLGGEAQGLAFVAYPYFRCEVEITPGGDLIVRKLTGSQRFEGKLYPDGDGRLVYLGAAAWGDEAPPAYGANAERDQIGAVERIGAERWRLALPWPKVESSLDIIELVK